MEDETVKKHHQFSGHGFQQTPGDSEGQWGPGALQSTGSQRSGHNLATEQQSNHTNPHPSPLVTTNLIFFSMTFFKYN